MRCEDPKPTQGSQIKRRVGADTAGSIMRVGVVSHSSSEKSLKTLYAAGSKATSSCTKNTHLSGEWKESSGTTSGLIVKPWGWQVKGSRGTGRSRWSGFVDREKGVREAGSRHTPQECALSLQWEEVLESKVQSKQQEADSWGPVSSWCFPEAWHCVVYTT